VLSKRRLVIILLILLLIKNSSFFLQNKDWLHIIWSQPTVEIKSLLLRSYPKSAQLRKAKSFPKCTAKICSLSTMGDKAVSSRILPAYPHISQLSRYVAKKASELYLTMILQHTYPYVNKKINEHKHRLNVSHLILQRASTNTVSLSLCVLINIRIAVQNASSVRFFCKWRAFL